MMDEQRLYDTAYRMRRAGSVVVLTGNALASESGVPTFQEALAGTWSHLAPHDVATPSAFRANPPLVWAWYEYRRQLTAQCQANAAHRAIADLEDLFPQVTVITQSIDGLHCKAGSTDVVALLGDLYRNRCSVDCLGNPTLIDISTLDWDRSAGPPPCPHCGEPIRPDVVWFTERSSLVDLDRAGMVSSRADVMLIVGAEPYMQPAASMPYRARHYNSALLIEISKGSPSTQPVADLFIEGAASQIMPQLVNYLRGMR